MLNPASPLAALLAGPVRPGVVRWLGLRPARRVPPAAVSALRLDPARGVQGDHYEGRSGMRQVTLIAAEQLAAIASHLGRDAVSPEALRRNVVVQGINLAVLARGRFRLGPALLQGTGECHPCSRMEAAFGPGGYNAVRGHGGITARVLDGGEVRLGDAIATAD